MSTNHDYYVIEQSHAIVAVHNSPIFPPRWLLLIRVMPSSASRSRATTTNTPPATPPTIRYRTTSENIGRDWKDEKYSYKSNIYSAYIPYKVLVHIPSSRE